MVSSSMPNGQEADRKLRGLSAEDNVRCFRAAGEQYRSPGGCPDVETDFDAIAFTGTSMQVTAVVTTPGGSVFVVKKSLQGAGVDRSKLTAAFKAAADAAGRACDDSYDNPAFIRFARSFRDKHEQNWIDRITTYPFNSLLGAERIQFIHAGTDFSVHHGTPMFDDCPDDHDPD